MNDVALKSLMLEVLRSGLLFEGDDPVEANIDYDKIDKLLINLPKFNPTENWGDPNHVDRKEVDRVMRTFRQGDGKEGVKATLAHLQRIQVEGTRITSPTRILKSIITLEILSMIVKGFGASAAGFVFESFIAAILGGKQVTEKRPDGGLPITDVYGFSETKGGKVSLSLKLLSDKRDEEGKGDVGAIHGSYFSLIDEIDAEDIVVYLIAYKQMEGDTAESIKLGTFEFNRDNLLDVLGTNSTVKNNYAIIDAPQMEKVVALIAGMFQAQQAPAEVAPVDASSLPHLETPAPTPTSKLGEINEDTIDDEKVQDLADQVTTPEENPSADPQELALAFLNDPELNLGMKEGKGLKHDQLKLLYAVVKKQWGNTMATNLMKLTFGYVKKEQWGLTAREYERLGNVGHFEDLGAITFSEEAIRKTVAIHINNIRDTLISMLESLRLITEETNKYLLTDDRGTAHRAGTRAIDNATQYEADLGTHMQQQKEKV